MGGRGQGTRGESPEVSPAVGGPAPAEVTAAGGVRPVERRREEELVLIQW